MKFNPAKYEIWLHLLFWTIYVAIMTTIYQRFMSFEYALLRNVVTGCFLALLVYFNLYVLIDRFLFREKYIEYAGVILVSLIVVTPFRTWADAHIQEGRSTSPIGLYSTAHYMSMVFSGIIVLGITTSLKLLQEWFRKKQIENDLQRYRLEAELKFLKAQVNPHFLFNVLNNIYSLIYLEGKAAAPQILKLSGLMRYMLYESDEDFVPLEKEIGYLKNYLELQQLKHAATPDIQFRVVGNISTVQIAPLLFIPFFENAFKHGDVLDNSTGFISTSIQTGDHFLQFSIQNSIAKKETRKDAVGGIGLENVKKRLHLLYPGRHTLEIENKNNIFSVNLKIMYH